MENRITTMEVEVNAVEVQVFEEDDMEILTDIINEFLEGVIAGAKLLDIKFSTCQNIARAMVIFCTWNPVRAFFGALLFGGLTALQFFFQAASIDLIPSYILKMMPYLLTIGVLVIVTTSSKQHRSAAPADLGVPCIREQ